MPQAARGKGKRDAKADWMVGSLGGAGLLVRLRPAAGVPVAEVPDARGGAPDPIARATGGSAGPRERVAGRAALSLGPEPPYRGTAGCARMEIQAREENGHARIEILAAGDGDRDVRDGGRLDCVSSLAGGAGAPGRT